MVSILARMPPQRSIVTLKWYPQTQSNLNLINKRVFSRPIVLKNIQTAATLYGLIPQTHAGKRVGDYCSKKTNRHGILGDNDPLDICVLSETSILRRVILVTAVPLEAMRAIDGNEADDKIIAVLKGDLF